MPPYLFSKLSHSIDTFRRPLKHHHGVSYPNLKLPEKGSFLYVKLLIKGSDLVSPTIKFALAVNVSALSSDVLMRATDPERAARMGSFN
jgi:hypothetical protein